MREFYNEYKLVPPIVAQLEDVTHFSILSRIPWSHNAILIEKLDSIEDCLWYANKHLKHDWNPDRLEGSIRFNIHRRQGEANAKALLLKSTIGLNDQCSQIFLHIRLSNDQRCGKNSLKGVHESDEN